MNTVTEQQPILVLRIIGDTFVCNTLVPLEELRKYDGRPLYPSQLPPPRLNPGAAWPFPEKKK